MINFELLESIWIKHPVAQVEEPEFPLLRHEWHWTERHLQCLWADDKLRPTQLRSISGDSIRVIDSGKWNFEAGPDFKNAVIVVGHQTLRGDVEIHVHPSDWNAHGHSDDPRYNSVVLHVTWFSANNEKLPDSMVSVALRDSIMTMRSFSFDAIDIAAYPHAMLPATPRPCGKVLADCTSAQIKEFLGQAGRHRIERKVERMRTGIKVAISREQAFYESILGALGYKHNAEAMRMLASALPVEKLSEYPDVVTRYAALLGMGGLLPALKSRGEDRENAAARNLWDIAWKLGVADLGETVKWYLGSTRPINHPRQRLAVAAVLFDSTDGVLNEILRVPQTDVKIWVKLIHEVFVSRFEHGLEELDEPFSNYLKLGKERLNSIVINVIIPFMIADGRMGNEFLNSIPGEAINEQISEAAFRLLGRDHNPALYSTSAIRMQGLLEIWNGFCLSAKNECAECPLAAALRDATENF